MTSRTRVATAFDHREPDTVPRWCGASAEFWAKATSELGLDDEGLRRRLGDDFRRVHSRYRGPQHELEAGATWESPFWHDVFFIGNDLGGQTGPLVGVDLFRRFLLPPLRSLIDLGHRYGLKVMMHCCGGYRPLIPDLIDAGMDGLHALQPDAAGESRRTRAPRCPAGTKEAPSRAPRLRLS